MARHCDSCGYRVEDRWANGCPICGGPLGGGGGGGECRPSRSGFDLGDLLGGRNAIYAVIGGLVLLSAGGYLLNRLNLGNRQPPNPPAARQADSTGRIRVGMPMHEVGKVLDAEAGRDPTAEGSLTRKFPAGDTRRGYLHWQKNGRGLMI